MIDSNFTVRLFFFKNGISNKTVVVASAFLHRAIHNSCSMGKTYGIQCLSFVQIDIVPTNQAQEQRFAEYHLMYKVRRCLLLAYFDAIYIMA